MRALRYLALAIVGLSLVVDLSLRTTSADELAPLDITPAKPNQPITLRDRLVVGLQARLKSEVNFCDLVADKVQAGELPQRLVDETFFWARQRASSIHNGHKYRPIVYFQPGLRARADRLHIALQ